jgi:hypothetical protein
MVLVPLPPCVIVTLLGEVESEKLGGGATVVLTETLSKVAVARAAALPLFTAKPTYTLCPIVIVWLVPTCTQFTPSVDAKLLKVFPLLLTFTQYGSVALTPPGSDVLPPAVVRTSK